MQQNSESQGSKFQQTSQKGRNGAQKLTEFWYEGQHREIVVYYLIAVAFLELIVGAVAFFYGVVHAVPLVPDGPRMAKFPWLGWLVASLLSPVGLLLILHLSGQFFSRSLNASVSDADSSQGRGDYEDVTKENSGAVPKHVERFYAIMRRAPTIVVLLGLIVMGATFLFLDSAMDVTVRIGQALSPYIPWILTSLTVFFLVCYLGRLFFVSRHHRMEQEYAYRMKVLEKTGIIITSKGCTPLRIGQNGNIQVLEVSNTPPGALPPGTLSISSSDSEKEDNMNKTGGNGPIADINDVDDINLSSQVKKTF